MAYLYCKSKIVLVYFHFSDLLFSKDIKCLSGIFEIAPHCRIANHIDRIFVLSGNLLIFQIIEVYHRENNSLKKTTSTHLRVIFSSVTFSTQLFRQNRVSSCFDWIYPNKKTFNDLIIEYIIVKAGLVFICLELLTMLSSNANSISEE